MMFVRLEIRERSEMNCQSRHLASTHGAGIPRAKRIGRILEYITNIMFLNPNLD